MTQSKKSLCSKVRMNSSNKIMCPNSLPKVHEPAAGVSECVEYIVSDLVSMLGVLVVLLTFNLLHLDLSR